MNKIKSINYIYKDFKLLFNKKKCPELFEAMGAAEQDYFPHSLGHFAILYTRVPREARPKLMLVGNNPSWFIDVNKNKTLNDKEKNIALERVKILERGVPSFSSYTQQPKHRFAKRLETEYKNASVFSLLENTVGMNRFWIQTGSKPDALKNVVLENSVSNARKNKQLDDLIEFCAEQTKNIIKIIDPHFLIILGTPARECLGNWHAPKSISVNFAKHPDRSTELSKVLLDIKPALDILS